MTCWIKWVCVLLWCAWESVTWSPPMCQITVELICGLSRNEPQVCMCVLSEKWVCRTFGCSLMSPDNPDFVRAPEYALLSAGKAERLMRHSRVSPLLPNIGRKLSSHHSLYNACCWYTSSVMGRGERKRQRERKREREISVMVVHLSNKLLTDNTSAVLTHGRRRLQLSHTQQPTNSTGAGFFGPSKTKTRR